MNRIEKIARLLEEFIRQDDRDREIAPSLKRMPKTDRSWEGFVSWAEKISRAMEESR